MPDLVVPDPGLSNDALFVGRERSVRVTVPEALSEIPEVKLVLDFVRRFLGEI